MVRLSNQVCTSRIARRQSVRAIVENFSRAALRSRAIHARRVPRAREPSGPASLAGCRTVVFEGVARRGKCIDQRGQSLPELSLATSDPGLELFDRASSARCDMREMRAQLTRSCWHRARSTSDSAAAARGRWAGSSPSNRVAPTLARHAMRHTQRASPDPFARPPGVVVGGVSPGG